MWCYHSRPDCNKGVLRILQSSSSAGASPSDCLVSYPKHALGKFYPSAGVQLMYSTALADWDSWRKVVIICIRYIYIFAVSFGLVWFGLVYGISTFVGYLTPNPFLCKKSVSISNNSVCQKYFYFKLFSLIKQLYIIIQFCVSTVSMSKNISISNNSLLHKHAV